MSGNFPTSRDRRGENCKYRSSLAAVILITNKGKNKETEEEEIYVLF